MLTLCLLLLAPGCAHEAADSGAPAPAASALRFDGPPPANLIILSIDTLRRDGIGRYGGAETPTLDALLAEGLVLEDHRSCSSWTYASMLCVFSGYTTDQLGFEPLHEETGEPDPLGPGFTLLGHLAGDAGLVSGIATTNLFLSSEFHTTAGFDYEHFDQTMDALQVVNAGLNIQQSLAEDAPDGGWLLQVHFLDPHDPYDPPEEYLEGLDALAPIDWDLTDRTQLKALREALPTLEPAELALIEAHLRLRYQGLTRYVDDQLARLLAELEARGALDDALVMVMTDHGEDLLDHGTIGHGDTLFNEETRSAVGFWSKDIVPGTWSGPTSHPDLLPTIAQAMGWSVDATFGGVAVGTAAENRPVLVHRYSRETTLQSVVVGDDKLIYEWSTGYTLYDLAADPSESADRYAQDPETAARLKPFLDAQRDAIEALYPEASGF